MKVTSIEPELIVVTEEFDQDIDVDDVPVGVSSGDNSIDLDSEAVVSLFDSAILSRGQTREEAFDGLEKAKDIVREAYPELDISGFRPVNTVFNVYVTLEDESVENVRDHLYELEGVNDGGEEGDDSVKVDSQEDGNISMSRVGFESYEVPEGTTHRVVVIGFNDETVEDHGQYLVEHLEAL